MENKILVHIGQLKWVLIYMVTINDSFVLKTLYCPKYYTYIYDSYMKRTINSPRFLICAPVGSTSSVPLENGDKARKEF
jgi:hypothetical protein